MSLAPVIRELIAAGLSGEALVAAVERIEAAEAPARSSAAIRQARYRERHAVGVTRDVTSVTDVTLSPSPDKEKSTKKEINPTPAHTYTREREASPLAEFRQAIMGVYALASMPAPAMHFADRWFDAGWPAEVVCDVIRAKFASTSGKNFPLQYFENSIAEAVAARNRPVPVGSPPARAGPNARPPSLATQILQAQREKARAERSYDTSPEIIDISPARPGFG